MHPSAETQNWQLHCTSLPLPTCVCKYLLRIVVNELPVDEAVDPVSNDLVTLLLHLVLLSSLNVSNLPAATKQ
jgi:hypothetical protein